MTTQMGKGHYPLVPATEYLDILDRYKNIPDIRPAVQEPAIKENKPKENLWKSLVSVKTLINVWVPTIMTVAGTIGGALIGAKYNTPTEHKHRPKGGIRVQGGNEATNSATYVYMNPICTNIQFAVIGNKEESPRAYWITTNDQGYKEVSVATQAEQIVQIKE